MLKLLSCRKNCSSLAPPSRAPSRRVVGKHHAGTKIPQGRFSPKREETGKEDVRTAKPALPALLSSHPRSEQQRGLDITPGEPERSNQVSSFAERPDGRAGSCTQGNASGDIHGNAASTCLLWETPDLLFSTSVHGVSTVERREVLSW